MMTVVQLNQVFFVIMERHDCHVACLLFNHLCCFKLYTGN
ncbi:unnamed protein product [Musa banksii]